MLIALLAIVTATRLSPALGTFYTTHVYPVIGRVISPVSGFVPFAIGDIFIFLSIAWAILYPAMKRTKIAVFCVAEYLLHGLGFELFTAKHLSKDQYEAC